MKLWQVSLVSTGVFFLALPVWAVKTPTEIVEIAKSVSVQVNPPDGYASAGGSGVIIAKEGNVYTVLTNDHVACLKAYVRESCVTAGTIRTNTGKSYEVIKGSVVSLRRQPSDPDLAIVKFSSSDQYPVATLGDSNQLQEATDIFIYGFPSLNNQIKEKRDATFGKGYIVALVSNSDAGYKLKYDIKTWWGQSGSPLFDPDGKVIGIHGRTDSARNPLSGQETQTGFNLGIPINTFKTVLAKTEIKVATVTNNAPSTFQTVNLNNPTDAETLYKRGTIAYNKKEYQSAINDLNQSISINPKNADAYYFRGDAKRNLGDQQGAIADYNEAIRIKPDYAFAYNNRGNVKSDLGDKNGAIADFSEAIRLKPDYAEAYFGRGNLYFLTKRYDDAIAQFNTILKIDLRYWAAINNIGLVEYERGNVNVGIAKWQEAISQAALIEDVAPEPKLALAISTYIKGDRTAGIKMGEAALKIDPRFGKLDFLKSNLWGDRLLADAKTFLNVPSIKELLRR